jgi:VanZ family protein
VNIIDKWQKNRIFYGSVAFITILVMYTVPIPGNSLLINAIQNAGHWSLFCVLTFSGCLLVVRSGRSLWLACVAIPAFMLLLGVAGEIVQIPLRRHADWSDIAADAQGVMSGLLIFIFVNFIHRRRFLIAGICLLIALAFAMINLRESVSQGIATITSPALPRIADFENSGAELRVRALRGAEIRLLSTDIPLLETPSRSLSIVLSGRRFSGVELLEVHRNWSDYARLVAQIVNTGTARVQLAIRISDRPDDIRETDGFHQVLTLEPGLNPVTVELQSAAQLSSRIMNLHDIRRLSFYAPAAQHPGTSLVLDDVKLE